MRGWTRSPSATTSCNACSTPFAPKSSRVEAVTIFGSGKSFGVHERSTASSWSFQNSGTTAQHFSTGMPSRSFWQRMICAMSSRPPNWVTEKDLPRCKTELGAVPRLGTPCQSMTLQSQRVRRGSDRLLSTSALEQSHLAPIGCPGQGSNLHDHGPGDFKSPASTNSATRARHSVTVL